MTATGWRRPRTPRRSAKRPAGRWGWISATQVYAVPGVQLQAAAVVRLGLGNPLQLLFAVGLRVKGFELLLHLPGGVPQGPLRLDGVPADVVGIDINEPACWSGGWGTMALTACGGGGQQGVHAALTPAHNTDGGTVYLFQGSQIVPDFLRGKGHIHGHIGHHAAGMNTGVRAPGADDLHRLAAQPRKYGLQLALNRIMVRLPLFYILKQLEELLEVKKRFIEAGNADASKGD